jgi:hypothetical protein
MGPDLDDPEYEATVLLEPRATLSGVMVVPDFPKVITDGTILVIVESGNGASVQSSTLNGAYPPNPPPGLSGDVDQGIRVEFNSSFVYIFRNAITNTGAGVAIEPSAAGSTTNNRLELNLIKHNQTGVHFFGASALDLGGNPATLATPGATTPTPSQGGNILACNSFVNVWYEPSGESLTAQSFLYAKNNSWNRPTPVWDYEPASTTGPEGDDIWLSGNSAAVPVVTGSSQATCP